MKTTGFLFRKLSDVFIQLFKTPIKRPAVMKIGILNARDFQRLSFFIQSHHIVIEQRYAKLIQIGGPFFAIGRCNIRDCR